MPTTARTPAATDVVPAAAAEASTCYHDGLYAAPPAARALADERAHDDEWVRHDESAAAAGLVRELPEGRVEASLLLEGLTCGACVWRAGPSPSRLTFLSVLSR